VVIGARGYVCFGGPFPPTEPTRLVEIRNASHVSHARIEALLGAVAEDFPIWDLAVAVSATAEVEVGGSGRREFPAKFRTAPDGASSAPLFVALSKPTP